MGKLVPMERSVQALFLLLLLCFAGIIDSSEGLVEEQQLERSLVSVPKHPNHSRKLRHRHSGFSLAECPDACSYRCSKTHHRKPCMFFCQKCCFKCRCVPPGTSGHKEVCACYNNWKTKTGGPKCP